MKYDLKNFFLMSHAIICFSLYEVPVKTVKKKLREIKDSGYIVIGSDILLHLNPSSKAGIQIRQPTGTTKRLSAFFVGMDRQPRLYFSFPSASRDEMLSICHPGYKVHASVLCEKGIGSIVYFDGVIDKVGTEPAIITTDVPEYITVNRIRKEARYPVSIFGWSIVGEGVRLPLKLIDISTYGCAFIVKHFSIPLKMGQEIQIFFDDIEIGKNMTLSGCICNQQKLLGSIVYGVKFDSFGIESGKHLFTYLEFNGQIMVARYGSDESHDNA